MIPRPLTACKAFRSTPIQAWTKPVMTPCEEKNVLVDLGLSLLNLREWQAALAVGAIIRTKGLAHV